MADTKVKRMTENKPVKKFVAGQVVAAIWQNEITVNGQEVTILKASVSRRYRDASGEWKSTGSLGRNEIPLAIYCLQKAFEFILADSQGDRDADGG